MTLASQPVPESVYKIRKGTRGPAMPTQREVARVAHLLEVAYGSPRHGNPSDPLDDLIYVILSNRTGNRVAQDVYRDLKNRFATWDELTRVPTRRLKEILRRAGLSELRSVQIKAIVRKVRRDFGAADLQLLSGWTDDAASKYLVSLPGVSEKVAKCVLLYTLDRTPLPVDVHVHRITRRLGWHRHKRADQSHESLERLVSPRLRYGFHVNSVAHGRLVCLASNPKCGVCPVTQFCYYYKTERTTEKWITAPLVSDQLRVAEKLNAPSQSISSRERAD